MKKIMLIILIFPIITLAANFSANYDGYYPGERIYHINAGAYFNPSILGTNTLIQLEENEMITIKKIIAILPAWQNATGEVSTDGIAQTSIGSFSWYTGLYNPGDYNDTGSASNVSFTDGLVTQNNWIKTIRGYGFKIINQHNGATYDENIIRYGFVNSGKYNKNPSSLYTDTMSYTADWVFYGPGTIKLVPSVEYPTLLDNSPSPSYIQIASTISGLDIRVTYVVETVGSDIDDDQSKFSVSLDDDGDRVAVGYKEEGSEAVVRVYEYSNGNWEQLGDDVE